MYFIIVVGLFEHHIKLHTKPLRFLRLFDTEEVQPYNGAQRGTMAPLLGQSTTLAMCMYMHP